MILRDTLWSHLQLVFHPKDVPPPTFRKRLRLSEKLDEIRSGDHRAQTARVSEDVISGTMVVGYCVLCRE